MDNLSKNLKYLMSKSKISSSELARKTGIGQPVISRLISGDTNNPQILTIKPLADYFGVSVDQLFGSTSLVNPRVLNNAVLHNINNKISTIKTIGSVLVDILPILVQGYQKAALKNLIKADVQEEILPLLQINSANLIKAANQIQNLLMNNNEEVEG